MMKENWTYKKLTDVCDIQYGYPFDSACFSTSPDEGMPLIRIRDVKDGHTSTYFKGDYPKEYIIHKGDYLVGMDGEFNIAPWKSEDALLNQRVCKVASKSTDVSMGFLYRFLIKELKKIEDETPFVTVKHLSAKRLNQVYLSIPTLSEQQRIVSELDLLQSIMDKQQAQLKELDNLAQAVFYDMFGDPVENEKGWENNSFKMVFRLKSGDGLSEKSFSGGSIPVFGGNGISGYHNEFNKSGKHIIIGRVGAYCGNVRFIQGDFWLTDNAFDTFFDTTTLDYWYTCYLLNMLGLHRFANHAAQPVISNIGLKDIMVILPPIVLQQTFATKIESIEKQKAAISQSIAETQKLFDYTMDKYFG